MLLRTATIDDIPELQSLISASARALSAGFYTAEQIEAAIRHVFGVDSQLVRDCTYYVVEFEGRVVAAGGWSRRRTLYGGDQTKTAEDPLLDPATEAARIRAFFVHPQWARRGLARRIYDECERAASEAGFRRFELMATRPGEPLYRALGFEATEQVVDLLPGGVPIEFSRMSRAIEPAQVSAQTRMEDVDEKALFTRFWMQESKTTRNVLAKVPENSDYRPDAKSRTAQEIAWQIVCEEKMIIEALETGVAQWEPPEMPKRMSDVLSAYERQSAGMEARWSALTDEQWNGTLQFFGNERPAGPMAWNFLFDIIHHRGQITTYLRPMGSTVPQIYGPSADEP